MITLMTTPTNTEDYTLAYNGKEVEISDRLELVFPISKNEFFKTIIFDETYINRIDMVKIDNCNRVIQGNELNFQECLYGIGRVEIYFTQEYLSTCTIQEYITGYIYHDCNCCVDDFRVEKGQFKDIVDRERYKIENEITTFKVASPNLKVTVGYLKSKDIEYNSDIVL